MTAYEQFSYVYDQLMTHAPYDDWIRFTKEIINKKQKQVTNIVDLGCGTGEITIRLAKEGFQTTGVDLSEDMLVCAANKEAAKKLSISWIQQNIRDLSGFDGTDIFISYCDVMNYIINKSDLSDVFQNVYDQLNKEGLFIFDIHNLAYAKADLIGHTFTDITDELTYIWECEAGDQEGEMFHYMTFFNKTKHPDTYIRFDERHQQRVYHYTIYEELLKKAGFSKIEFCADFSSENSISLENSERIFIIAEK